MDKISENELDRILQFAIRLSKQASVLLIDALEARRAGAVSGGESEEKSSAVDIVTQTDKDVERYIQNAITKTYPHHDFIGEETYSQGSSRAYQVRDAVPTWVVDPLDGTVNFTHGFPMFCISIALVHRGKAVVGVVYAPLLGQLFSARKGHGAWLNETTRLPLLGKAIGPIPVDAPSRCVFACEWGKDRRDHPTGNLHRKVESFVNMAAERGGRDGKGGMVHGVRSLGSAALDLAYTAMGGIDLWWEGGCWEWDVAAGICILEEAGGLVTTANPPRDGETCTITDAPLGGRLYLAVRPASDGPGETARQGQERVVREVWRRVLSLDYSRPGS